jgi:hypothetical protein
MPHPILAFPESIPIIGALFPFFIGNRGNIPAEPLDKFPLQSGRIGVKEEWREGFSSFPP